MGQKRKSKKEKPRKKIKKWFKKTGEKMETAFEKTGDVITDAAKGIFNTVEDAVDIAWKGETDKEEQKRLKQEQDDWEESKQVMFDAALYGGVGLVLILAIVYVYKS